MARRGGFWQRVRDWWQGTLEPPSESPPPPSPPPPPAPPGPGPGPGPEPPDEEPEDYLPDSPDSGSLRTVLRGYGLVDIQRDGGSEMRRRDLIGHFQAIRWWQRGGRPAHTTRPSDRYPDGRHFPRRDAEYFRRRIKRYEGMTVSGRITAGPSNLVGTRITNAVIETDMRVIRELSEEFDFRTESDSYESARAA